MHFLALPAEQPMPMEGGRFAELSTLHLSARTARLLDIWAGPGAHGAPVLVAANVKGWFVATLPTAVAFCSICPKDLGTALRFGRFRGFDYLFFHCDAPVVADLPRIQW